MNPMMNLKEIATEDKDFNSPNTPVLCAVIGAKNEKNFLQNQNIDLKTLIKQHTERQKQISTDVQVRRNNKDTMNDSAVNYSPDDSKRHLTEETQNESFVAYSFGNKTSPVTSGDSADGPLKASPKGICSPKTEKENQSSTHNLIEELKKQNKYLMAALMKIQKTQLMEKKNFNEILSGIDKALSSLPVRLEKIRFRNQRNLSVVKSIRLNGGDGNESHTEQSVSEATHLDSPVTGRKSSSYLSSRMKTLLDKIDQLNDLIKKIQNGESPIELLVNSELQAISLLKKEIKLTKKQIDNGKSDTETLTSFEESPKYLAEDSSSKTKNSFSNELNKASNFKIFENHMMLQEEALNLLTRKIKETEEALLEETEAKEALKRKNEAMAKEIFRLKSAEEETKGEKSQKTEKLKAEVETIGNRPYRLIKELKAKLEEKEKALIVWKSKYSRVEAAGTNKSILLDSEKKKNIELEKSLKYANAKNKSVTSELNSLQSLKDQLLSQIETLENQVSLLTEEKFKREFDTTEKNIRINELIKALKEQEQNKLDKEEEVKTRLRDINNFYQKELEDIKIQIKNQKDINTEFKESIKQLLTLLTKFSIENNGQNSRTLSYCRIQDILNMSASECELFFNVYSKTTLEKEVEILHQRFQHLINGKEPKFSESLSSWLFEIIAEKMLTEFPAERNNLLQNNK